MTFDAFLDAIYCAQTQYERALADADADATYKKTKIRQRTNAVHRASTNPDCFDATFMQRLESDVAAANTAWRDAVNEAAQARQQKLFALYTILTGERQ